MLYEVDLWREIDRFQKESTTCSRDTVETVEQAFILW